jgi:hypothetical protein
MTTYDTYGASSSAALTTALNNVASGKVIAIISYDATELNQSTRDVLVSKFAAPLSTTWGQSRIAHSFIGRADDPEFRPVERVSDSSNLVDTYISWPLGSSGEIFAVNYFGGGGTNDMF